MLTQLLPNQTTNTKPAMRFVAGLYAVLLAVIGWLLLAHRSASMLSFGQQTGPWLAGLCALLLVAALVVSGRVIRAHTGFDVDFMVGTVWLPGGLSLLIPGVQLLALGMGLWRLYSKKIGGFETKKKGGGRYYPEVSVSNGEARPLGLTFLGIGLLWPLILYLVFTL